MKKWLILGILLCSCISVDATFVDTGILSSGTEDVYDCDISQGHVTDNAILNLYGGSITSLYATNSSTLNMYGGIISQSISCSLDSTVNISGGSIGEFSIGGNSTATFSGGEVNVLYIAITNFNTTFICDVDSLQYSTNTKILTGNWLNNNGSFEIITPSFDRIQFIPEPTSLSLIGLGALIFRKRR